MFGWSKRQTQRAREDSLELSLRTIVVPPMVGAVVTLDLDPAESRYLLAAGTVGSLAIYDTEAIGKQTRETSCLDPLLHRPLAPKTEQEAVDNRALAPLCTTERSLERHCTHVTCARWYPVDNGLFVSGSMDQTVHVWDTNTMDAIATFPSEQPVLSLSMSPIAVTHALVAVATQCPEVRLLDMRAGAFVQVMRGHQDHVLDVRWAGDSETLLFSASKDGSVRLWDIHPTAFSRAAPRAHEEWVNCLEMTADGTGLLSFGRDGCLRWWDLMRMKAPYGSPPPQPPRGPPRTPPRTGEPRAPLVPLPGSRSRPRHPSTPFQSPKPRANPPGATVAPPGAPTGGRIALHNPRRQGPATATRRPVAVAAQLALRPTSFGARVCGLPNQNPCTIQMATSPLRSHAFVPVGRDIAVVDFSLSPGEDEEDAEPPTPPDESEGPVVGGRVVKLLKGHNEPELFSAGQDRTIYLWSPTLLPQADRVRTSYPILPDLAAPVGGAPAGEILPAEINAELPPDVDAWD
ncbi:putative DNA excision repair protein ERCC-8 [Paratrimastix pyriformis]|uniref:DNA excision repair protein ERCC-8 n=1 Tax=Paratrimastix pyriformis TaxID=342808 RepID=A0ABQ8UHA7_9EUKA|nr:putative DNA excision repair protein ERCC-8 [Paratrimastix pyriformis]